MPSLYKQRPLRRPGLSRVRLAPSPFTQRRLHGRGCCRCYSYPDLCRRNLAPGRSRSTFRGRILVTRELVCWEEDRGDGGGDEARGDGRDAEGVGGNSAEDATLRDEDSEALAPGLADGVHDERGEQSAN